MIQLQAKCNICGEFFEITYNSFHLISWCPVCGQLLKNKKYMVVRGFYLNQHVRLDDRDSINYQSIGVIKALTLNSANVRIAIHRGKGFTTDWINLDKISSVNVIQN